MTWSKALQGDNGLQIYFISKLVLDGNKRMGTHLMLLLLYFNDIKIQYSQTELSDIILDIAADKKSFEFLVEWIKKHKC